MPLGVVLLLERPLLRLPLGVVLLAALLERPLLRLLLGVEVLAELPERLLLRLLLGTVAVGATCGSGFCGVQCNNPCARRRATPALARRC